MTRRLSFPILALILLSLVLSFRGAGAVQATSLAGVPRQEITPPEALPPGTFVARVYYEQLEDYRRLVDFDILEYNNTQQKYWLALVNAADYRTIRALGFRVEVDAAQTASLNQPRVIDPDQVDTIPGYSCYRTVEETYASAAALVTAHPDLATWSDVGDSWEKSVGQADGYDLMMLKLTNSAIAGPKPKLLVLGAIHAREYATAELVTRFAEELVNGYGTDADATWLLDWHEIHLLLQTNPDGRKEAEGGTLWRKNTNENYCGATSSSRGADLNRNFTFQWNCCGGSSGNTCSETYRGPTAGSEPEIQAVDSYLRAIFPDQRDPQLTAAAPVTATGVFIDMHSAAELVLWPWGMTSTAAPNSTALQTLGRKFAYFNGYTPEQSMSLYATDGATDDQAYGTLGVAAYTIELSGQFFQPCTDFTADLNGNLPALRYAAKVARTPYQTPAGPDALTLAVSPGTVTAGAATTLTASINDTRYNQTNGTEPTQAIAAAEYYIDTPPWAGGTAIAMAASDGSFNNSTEGVTATVNTGCLAAGKHIIFVRGKDANGNWGAFSAIFLNVTAPTATDFTLCVAPAAQAVCAPADAQYQVNVGAWGGFSGNVTLSTSSLPAGATSSFSTNPVAAPGASTLTLGSTSGVTAGSYTFTVSGTGSPGAHSSTAQITVYAAALAAPATTVPANGSTGIAPNTGFTWGAVTGAATYEIQVAADPAFSSIVASGAGLTIASFTPKSGALALDTVYYWRVRAVRATNACNSAWSAAAAFRTAATTGTTACYTVTSNDVAKAIPYNSYVDSVINFPQTFTVSDVNVKIDHILHPNDADADIYLRHPDGTLVELATDCGSTGDHYVNTVFDDAASNVIGTTGYNSAPFTGTYNPEGALSDLNNKTSYGAWSLHVLDDNSTASTAGTIQAWSLTLCGSVTATSGDYSDLASSYGVAWHTGSGAVRLGPAGDWDTDTSFAAGTDNSTDNGVTRTAFSATTGGVNLTVTGGQGYVTGWFDWNQDGDFTDTGEQVFANQAVSAGSTVPVSFSTNGNSVYDKTLNARFRVYASQQTLGPEAAPQAFGGVADGEVEDYTWYFSPLAVNLASFTAAAAADGVTLAWETVSETDNAGFNIYRADAESGPWTQVNAALIPALTPGASEGHAYTWADATAAAGTYWYMLEDVALDGTATQHEPVSVTVAGPNAVSMTTFSAAGAAAAAAMPALVGLTGLALAALGGAAARRRRME